MYKIGSPLTHLIVPLIVTSQSLKHGLPASNMKYSFSLAAFAAFVAATPTPSLEKDAVAACASAVTLAAGSNPFTGRTLHANSVYAKEISDAMANVTDASIQAAGAAVAKVGTFLWM